MTFLKNSDIIYIENEKRTSHYHFDVYLLDISLGAISPSASAADKVGRKTKAVLATRRTNALTSSINMRKRCVAGRPKCYFLSFFQLPRNRHTASQTSLFVAMLETSNYYLANCLICRYSIMAIMSAFLLELFGV